ncbi:MAG: ASCH domain-containing protein [Anaerolineaceae bacterium]|nr:ASCH domain-containing protein [Anaerolineaceae bacterium]
MTNTSPSKSIQSYWHAFIAQLPAEKATQYTTMPEAWGFGDAVEMADELGALVVAGTKTATCSLLWEYEVDNETIPQVGNLSIILDGKNNPICIIKTTEINIRQFNAVDANFAYDEGEDDRTLESWRKAHWRYFSRICQNIGCEVTESMPLICERFQVIWRG